MFTEIRCNRRWVTLSCLGALLASLASTAPRASAATEIGSACEGNFFLNELTEIGLTHGAGSPLPAAAPSSGVIASWRTNLAGTPLAPISAFLKVLRPTGVPNQFQVVGASAAGSLAGTQSIFLTRIPIQAGDHIGLSGVATTPVCATKDKADSSGFSEAPTPVGATQTYEAVSEFQVPVVAAIEADADGDGFGDETQDRCKEGAAYQTDCPAVAVRRAEQRRSSVVILVTSSLPAPIEVTGTVGLGGGKRVKLTAPSRNVVPGKAARFRLTLRPGLQARLDALSPKQSLRLKIAAEATNVIGGASTDALTTRLRRPPGR